MAHWIETYPHTVYASVLLKDNKIANWKIGERCWESNMDMARRISHSKPFNMADYAGETVESIGFEVNSSEEHNHAISVLAENWFRQWEIHENCEGQPAYEEELNYFDVARKLLPLSNCLKRQYACVIVLNGHTIATGHNKSLTGCAECAREGIAHNTGDYAECQSIHSEQMSLIRASGNLEGAELYLVCADEVDPVPCPTCAKLLNWAGVKVMREVREWSTATCELTEQS